MDLESFLRERGIWFRFVEKNETIHTFDAAKAAGLPLERVTKNLVAKTDRGEYVLLVVPGDKKVNLRRVASILGAKSVGLVPFERAQEISGYPPGATPSIGHKTKMRVLMDSGLLRFETLFSGGGSRSRLVELKTVDIRDINEANMCDIAE
jgi:Cys-tRNA(Pro)/Cys-tRNA(Cys) deacylase